jgi:hypothetical protein
VIAMQEDRAAARDPASGYASADALEPADPMNRDRSGEGESEEQRDARSGYASADLLDPSPGTSPEHADEVRDPMSGYASADTLGPEQEQALMRSQEHDG